MGCGECTACCTVLGVKALQKDDYTPCQHCTGTGCGIYTARPAECRTYECLQLHGKPEHRPDRLGVILEATDVTLGGHRANAVVVREVWPGASEQEHAQALVHSVAYQFDAFIYVVRKDGSRSAIFPPWAEHLRPYAQQIVERSWRDRKKDLKARRKELKRRRRA